jgi:uncharacterized membrane protein
MAGALVEGALAGVSEKDDAGRTTPSSLAWRALPWVLALVFAVLYATISLSRFERLATRSFDLGIFEQAIRHYAHFQAPIVDIEGPGHNFLGDHWSPAIAVFAPFYRLVPSPRTLLVGQAVLISLAVAPMTRMGIRHLGRWSGVAVGLAFGMSYGIQNAVDFDIHEVCVAVPLLAFALEAFLARRWKLVAAWAAPLVLVKEDLGMTVAAIGLALVLVGARRWGTALAAFGAASFTITMTVLLPHFDAGGISGFSRLSVQPGSASLLQRMLNLGLEVGSPGLRAVTILMLLLVTALLAPLSPLMVVALPTLAWRFVSTNEAFWGQWFHYDLVLMPIVFAAMVDAMVRLRHGPWRLMRGYARAAPTLAVLVALFFVTRFSLGDLFDPGTYRANPRTVAAERILSAIPDGATVETDFGLMSRLTSRTQVFWIGSAAPVVPQYVLLDDRAGWNPPITDPVQYAQVLHPGTTYVLVNKLDGYKLVRRAS